MKKARPYLLISLFIIAILSFKFIFFPGEKPKPQSPNGNDKKPAIPVTVHITGGEGLEDKIFASGTILANEEVELRSETNGIVTYLNLPEGKTVEAGTLLLKLNDADLVAQFDKILVQLKLVADIEFRQRRLWETKYISQQEYEQAQANLKSIKADSAYQKALIARTEIRAPFRGVIGIRNVSIGSYITPSILIAKIQQIDPVKIDFSIPEKYSSLFKVGDLIRFKTESSQTVYNVKITVRDPQVDLASRSIRYHAVSSNKDLQLLPGASARVELLLKDAPTLFFVPTESVIPILTGKKVYVVKDGKAEERKVETGLRTEDNIQILSGLESGDSVIVTGNFQVKKGSSVKIIKKK